MTAIEFENISKQYRLGLVSTKTLSHDLNRWWQTSILGKEDPYLKIGETNDRSKKGESDYVWALKDINFKVEQGDVVGIIGKNGAGKSTLLKLLSRVTGPTIGTIRARGRIASLLEVGTGFHPEMTGRENIYLNGAIMGMTKAEIDRKLDEIVDFSGCERYLDTPVKRYSSGMTVRLGFAVAAHLDPEILVVDEVLAVGDAEFQKKAIGKMQDVSRGEGRTVLFVSHNMGAVRNLCTSGLVLKNGQIDFMGTSEESIEHYLTFNKLEEECIKKVFYTPETMPDSKDVGFLSIEFEKGNNSFSTLEPIVFKIKIKANKTVEDCRINTTIFSREEIPLGGVSSLHTFCIKKGEVKTIRFELYNHNFVKGLYFPAFSVGTGNFSSGQHDFDVIMRSISFTIDKYSEKSNLDYALWPKSWGVTFIPYSISIID